MYFLVVAAAAADSNAPRSCSCCWPRDREPVGCGSHAERYNHGIKGTRGDVKGEVRRRRSDCELRVVDEHWRGGQNSTGRDVYNAAGSVHNQGVVALQRMERGRQDARRSLKGGQRVLRVLAKIGDALERQPVRIVIRNSPSSATVPQHTHKIKREKKQGINRRCARRIGGALANRWCFGQPVSGADHVDDTASLELPVNVAVKPRSVSKKRLISQDRPILD